MKKHPPSPPPGADDLFRVDLNGSMVVRPDAVAPTRRARGGVEVVDATHYLFQAGVSAKEFVARVRASGDPDLASAKATEASWRKSWPEMQGYFDAMAAIADGEPS